MPRGVRVKERWEYARKHTKGFRAVKREILGALLVAVATYAVRRWFRSSSQSLVDDLVPIGIAAAVTIVVLPAAEFLRNYLQAARRILDFELDQKLGQVDELRNREAQRDAEITGLRSAASPQFLALMRERQKLEAELQPLMEIEECGIKVSPAIQIGKSEDEYRAERIARIKRDITAIDAQLKALTPDQR
jgi:hypothetical protein